MNKNSKIYIAGHLGLVGSAILRKLNKEGYTNLITKSRKELDLTDQKAVKDFFEKTKPEYVFLAAAKVGGIMANKTYPGEFISENLDIQNNIIKNSYIHGVKKLLFLGSSCIYPKLATQPIKEEYFMTGPLEPTNEAYAIAKIAGISMCQSYRKQYGADFISLMPTNLYGPGDNFTNERGHVIPALIRKFHDAKAKNLDEISAWGTGSAKREFLHSDDLADACVFLMKNYSSGDIINVGTGEDVTIKELTEKISKIVGFKGKIVWDTTKPDGAPRRLLDVEKLHTLGWKHHIELEKGLEETYEWFKKNVI
ncbi:MAG TPA: GDP-L-fucose synthase [Candidatus Paceibacterota bacterium]|jgi:GDP-L-fucose synthase|nr:GDP-L-fucose synthase [Candidatus Paceibacterota bacterium]